MSEQPNIVVIMSDEHDPAVTGCYGDPLVETPNLDRLASEGITSGYAMIRQRQWKYVYHTPANEAHGPERELYDLEADPEEFTNLAADPSQSPHIQSMHAALAQELGEEPDLAEQRCREDYARGYDRAY